LKKTFLLSLDDQAFSAMIHACGDKAAYHKIVYLENQIYMKNEKIEQEIFI
jgi:hypothetical protein